MFVIFSVLFFVAAATTEYADVGIESKEYTLSKKVFGGGILKDDTFFEQKDEDTVSLDNSVQLPEELLKQLQIFAADLEQDTGINANVNNYSDQILSNIKRLMIRLRLDPMQIPDIRRGFSKRFFIITYSGSIDLTRGWLNDASTVKRQKDIIVSYSPSGRKLIINIPLKFDKLEFNYKYSAKFMGLGPVGGLEGRVRNLELFATIVIDFETYKASLETFKIIDSGFIDLTFTGNILTDWLVNIFTDTVSLFLHRLILSIVSNTIHDGLNDVVDDINGIINVILNPPTFRADHFVSTVVNGIQWY